jgi:tetratricopeptide (TPR) repeat protein
MMAVLFLLGGFVASPPLRAWEWTEDQGSVIPSLQEEFDQEVAVYRGQTEKGMSIQERLIALDRIISHYKPQGVNTVVIESERDRLTLQLDSERKTSQSAQVVSTKLYQLAIQKSEEGRFVDALSAIQKAERLVPDDSSISQMRRKLEGVTAIAPNVVQASQPGELVRKGVARYLENDGARSLNALRYAAQLEPSNPFYTRLVKLVEKDYPDVPTPAIPRGKTLVDYKLQQSLEFVYDGHYLKAIETCNQVLDLDPDNVLALTRMGSAYYAMGQKQEARSLWTRALQLEPKNEVLRHFLRDKF